MHAELDCKEEDVESCQVSTGYLPTSSASLLCDPGAYWWPPAYSTWGPTIVSFSFFHNLLFLAVFRVLNFQSRFETPNGDSMPKLRPWEVETPIYPNGAHSFGTSSPRVKFLDVYGFPLFLNRK